MQRANSTYLEVVQQVVPRSQVEYDATIFGGELGPYEV